MGNQELSASVEGAHRLRLGWSNADLCRLKDPSIKKGKLPEDGGAEGKGKSETTLLQAGGKNHTK